MDILDLLATDNYIVFNKDLAKIIGLENAILFGALCGYQRGFKQKEFFREQDKIMEDTCMTEYAVRKATKELQELNLITVVKKGLPAKFYYTINIQTIMDMLNDKTTSGVEMSTTGDIQNETTYKNNNKNNINNERKNGYTEIINAEITNEELKNTLYEFIKMRKMIKKPLTDLALKRIITKLHKLANTPDKAIAVLEQSIVNCWQDIYEIHQDYKNTRTEKKAVTQRVYTEEELNSLYDDILDINI